MIAELNHGIQLLLISIFRKNSPFTQTEMPEVNTSGISVLIYASNDENAMLAWAFEEYRDNEGNSQSVFLIVQKI